MKVTRVIDDGAGRLNCDFCDGPIGGPNRIQHGFDAFPSARRRPPSLEIEVRSAIPLRGGLGSSAAATIAGIRLRELVDGRRDRGRNPRCGVEDRRAPRQRRGGDIRRRHQLLRARRRNGGGVALAWPKRWRIIVATPHVQLATSVSRRALPKRLPLGGDDLQHAACRAAVECAANRLRRRHARGAAGPHASALSQALVPGLRRLLAVRHPDVIGVCLSGAGPTVAVFASGNAARGREPAAGRVRTGTGGVHGENSKSPSGR